MQDLIHNFLEMFKDLPGFLNAFVDKHGIWVYGLLFAIIFAETGLVILPFLPGDSLLFTVGAIGAGGAFDKWGGIWTISILLIIAGVMGDAVNYHVGKAIGPRIFRGEASTGFIGRYLNRKHLERAHAFFEKYGGKAVILGRFVPIVRTFVPFVAGAGAMNYSKFALFNITGAILWIGICVAAGYFFGNIEVVKKNFEIVVIGIVIVSVLPVVIELVIARRKHKAALASQNQ